jgi:hypothetical protein
MISIHDGETLLGRILNVDEIIQQGVNFISQENDELQIAIMNHPEGRNIQRHFHPKQERKIQNTTEILIVTEGVLEVNFFDLKGNLKWSGNVQPISVVALIAGGHSFKSISESKFIEIKHGPYDSSKDKIHY